MKTSELTGAALDWAVAKIEEPSLTLEAFNGEWERYNYAASIDWAQGGPIIEREWIELTINTNVVGETWLATRVEGSAICEMTGPTQLIAAMRCYVKSQLGDEIEIPSTLNP